MTKVASKMVSFESDPLILVDENDQPTGSTTKALAHDGDGLLHRAFSVFLFNEHGEVLLQQRSTQKRLWPLYWSNSCCSHPRLGEDIFEAALRRTQEELGLETKLHYLYKFQYQARFDAEGSENELCYVFVGRAHGDAVVNENEIAAWRWVSPQSLAQELAAKPQHFTPWFKLEWTALGGVYKDQIQALLSQRR